MFKGKVAIVTGGTRGIGYGISQQLSQDGYALALFGTSNEEKVEDSLNKLREGGQPVLYIQGSLGDSVHRNRLVDRVMEEFGRIDVLVNNAGVAPKVRGDLLDMTEESFDFVVDTNMKGTFFLTQRVAKEMVSMVESGAIERPMIINIASISSYTSSTSRGEYCISKAGISMSTQLFADRLAEYGINVYEIRPGIIWTDMTSAVKEKYDRLIGEGLTPIQRWGYPEDVANAVSVLCSGKLAFSTGEVINVDGGFHLRRL